MALYGSMARRKDMSKKIATASGCKRAFGWRGKGRKEVAGFAPRQKGIWNTPQQPECATWLGQASFWLDYKVMGIKMVQVEGTWETSAAWWKSRTVGWDRR